MSEREPHPMYYRMLGNTGLQVSVLSYGFWATFGVKPGLTQGEGVEVAKRCLATARARGVNLFDNAETYGEPQGEAERLMGEAIKQLQAEDPHSWRRAELVITTKVFWAGAGVNEKGLSRKHIMEGIEASLKRLQMDYVDLYFCHRPDPFTPTETVVRAMTDVVRSGRATAWGTSEWSAQQITEAFWIARMEGLEPPQFEQPQYNMLERQRVEVEYHPLYAPPYSLGTTVWSPLASGILTGKYNDGIPEGSRMAQKGYGWLVKVLDKQRASGAIAKIKALASFAESELGCNVGQLALAWCVKNPNVTTTLLGATSVEQLTENLDSIQVAERLTPQHMAHIEELLGNRPTPYQGYGGEGMRPLLTL